MPQKALTQPPGAQAGLRPANANPMRAIRLEKLTLNMGAGESGPKLEKAKAVLKKIAGIEPVTTITRTRSTFGVAKHRPIGAKVTLRGPAADALLRRLLQAVESKLKPGQFDAQGNFSFGVAEYINIPGIKYDPELGILGLDVCVTLTRPGYRVQRRRLRPSRVGASHRITPQEAREFVAASYGVKVQEEK